MMGRPDTQQALDKCFSFPSFPQVDDKQIQYLVLWVPLLGPTHKQCLLAAVDGWTGRKLHCP